jgi:hypothetical protein
MRRSPFNSLTVIALAVAAAGCGGGGGGSKGPLVAVKVSHLGGGAFDYTQGSYLVGFRFQATSAITVTDLGYWDSNLEGSFGETFAAVPVALYDLTTHQLLASATVLASDPATGFYRYAALGSPVAVGTADTYAVVAVTGTDYYVAGVGGACAGGYACSGASAGAGVHVLGGACLGGGDACLTQTDVMTEPTDTSTWVNLGPNFIYELTTG